MKKIALLMVSIVFIPGILKAQSSFQQLTFGGGVGVAGAYAGAQVQKTTLAAFAAAGYYPIPDLNFNLEGQVGALAGAAIPGQKDLKSFNNHYQAIMLDADIHLGLFFDYRQSNFLTIIKGFYGGAGYGVVNDNVTNTDLANPKTTDNVKNTVRMVPVILGYEYNLLNQYNEPFLKLCLSYSFNYCLDKGIDGYPTTYTNGANYYNYISAGIKYTIILRGVSGRTYNKLD